MTGTASPSVSAQASPPRSSTPQLSPTPHVVALLTCHNRRQKTEALLQSLQCQQPFHAKLSIVLVDDGSTDGTADMVKRHFPVVHVVQGSGDLFWCGGMRLAHASATARFADAIDYLLWLNDDVVLDSDALPRLLQQASQLQQMPGHRWGALVGAVRQPNTQQLSYGGRVRGPWWAPLRFSAILPNSPQLQRCDFINGNVCLLPYAALTQIGGLSAEFTHSMADYDAGLRLQQQGYSLYQAAGSYGSCAGRPVQGSIADRTLPRSTRLAMLQQPNHAAPVAQWQLFLRRHGGPFSMIGRLRAQLRQWFPRWYLSSIAKAPERKRVVVVQQVLRQYRLAFWHELYDHLASNHIELLVIFGEPDAQEALKQDAVREAAAPWFIKAPVRQWGPWCWQYHPVLATADVVVCEHALRHVLPYYLKLRGIPLVWWGHGYDHHADPRRLSAKLSAWWRRQLLRLGHHYLAYTAPVAEYLEGCGLASSQITVVNNSQDCSAVRRACLQRQVPTAPLTVLYCGSLYREKRLDLLIDAVKVAQAQGVVQRLIIVGDGPFYAELAALNLPWLQLRGALFGDAKASAYAEADLVLNPGLTGLAVLDAFAAGLPYITCSDSVHSPEIAYVRHNRNALVVDGTVAAVVEAIRSLCQVHLWQRLSAQARQTDQQLPLSAMVASYAIGLKQALGVLTYDVCLVHQAYRQRGGEDVVVERDCQWLQAQGLSVCVHRTRWHSSWRFALQVFSRMLRPVSISTLPAAHCYWLHNTQGSFGLFAARDLKRQRNALVLQTLHNMRPLWPGGVFRPGQWHGAEFSCIGAAWQQKPWRGSRFGSAWFAFRNYRQRQWHQAVDVLVCPSAYVQREYLAAGVEAAKLRLKPHFSPAPLFSPASHTHGAIRCLFVGRVDEHKGLSWLLELWPELATIHDEPLRLTIITPDAVKDEQRMTESPANVRWLHGLAWLELSEQYAQADLVIVPSLVCETFGNVMIEAASHGCIVLASNVGALPELAAVLGSTLFSAGDPIDFKRQFRQVLQQLPTDAQAAIQQRHARYQQWAQHFSAEAQPTWPVGLIEQQRP